MKTTLKTVLTSTLLAAVSTVSFALPDVIVKTDKADAVYKCGEEITVTAQVVENGKPLTGQTVNYHYLADGRDEKRGSFVTTDKPFVFKTKLDKPGAMRIDFILLDKNGKKIPIKRRLDQHDCISGRVGAVAEPEKLLPQFERPADFSEYWAAQRKKLNAIPVKELAKKEVYSNGKIKVYDIQVACLGKPVSGYVGIPTGGKGKYPVRIVFHGAGVRSALRYVAINGANKGFITLDINAHGILNGQPGEYYKNLQKGELKNYYYKKFTSRIDHYFHSIIIRIIRTLEYVKTIPQWDGKNIIVEGGSQGGYQALIAAGLDNAVTLCRASVPAFSDFYGEFFGDPKRMTRFHVASYLRSGVPDEAQKRYLLNEYAYLDPVSFARDIKCPTFISLGFCDLSSPTTSVYGIFNTIPANVKKSITTYPNGIHGTSGAMPEADKYEKSLWK